MSGVATIILPGKDDQVRGRAIVDFEDFIRLGHMRWALGGRGYAMSFVGGIGRRGPGVRGPGHYVYLHREVLGLTAGDGLQVDHINRNKLDCRKANLRVIPQAANNQNKRGYGTSEHRGVGWDRSRRKWVAYAKLPGRPMKNLGRFDEELEAARVAAEYRAEHMPYATD